MIQHQIDSLYSMGGKLALSRTDRKIGSDMLFSSTLSLFHGIYWYLTIKPNFVKYTVIDSGNGGFYNKTQ